MRVIHGLCVVAVVFGLCLAASAAQDAGVAAAPTVSAPAAAPTSVAAPVVAAPASRSALGEVLDAIIKIVVGVLGVLGAYLVHKAILWVSAKLKIDVPAGVEDQINTWAREGIAFAEEQAVKLADKAPTGPEKLEMAANYVIALAQQHGVVDYARDKIVAKVEALLNIQRASA